ncbi:hypothetical protein F3Y22_tig00110607pilonHSYRG00166 [Hibiscus syriacus]|uniref:DUF4283 domain-containing protein n=1 Tax=Hibiscus syriacus TaxID=106335 RepID=A0A6A3A100_HIBSY|nr:hypothetical protein F3Y22_tig00110607pilonHSYRG00166 [Hibiscus syriacus]
MLERMLGNMRSFPTPVRSRGQSKRTEDVVSLQAIDKVVVLDGECIVDNNGQYPVIQFTDQVHDRIDYSMWRSIIDLENDYFLVKFESEQDYIHVLMEGPWTIFGSYLTVQLWSRTFSTMEKHPSQVVKINYSTNSGERGRFTSLAVLVNLNKTLILCIKIDVFWKKIEYEGLQQICFHCGVYGHSKGSCGYAEVNTSKGGVANDPSAVMDKTFDGEKAGFEPWMIAKTSRMRTKKNPDLHPKVSSDVARGSQFVILNDIDNNPDVNHTSPPVVPGAENNKRNGSIYTPRMENPEKG